MFRKGVSVATIGIFIASMLAVINPATAVVPAPANYMLDEYAWLKEDGVDPSTWAQYNNTGWNRLNLSYRFSKVDIAYVCSSSSTAENFNITFIVVYNTTTSGFNTTGHFFGNPPQWNRTVPAASTQTAGLKTYYLFTTVYDPQGNPGIYEVRILSLIHI